MAKFGYNPVGLGKPIKSKQVVGFIEQPWYTRLMTSGSFQVLVSFQVSQLSASFTFKLMPRIFKTNHLVVQSAL